jgi:hypothetical protein
MFPSGIDPAIAHFVESPVDSLNAQINLDSLAQEFPLRKHEAYLPNEYYGFDYILKNHLKLNPKDTLFFAVPHGVEVEDNKNWNLYGNSERVSTLIYTNEHGRQNLIQNRNCGFRFRAISPMWLLYKKMVSYDLVPSTDNNNNALFFPAHGNPDWFLKNNEYDARVCLFLNTIKNQFDTIDISLTASDIRQRRHLVYEDYGYNVITAGDINDPFFASRFINNVHRYGSILTSQIGSHIFYCSAFGLRTRFYQTKEILLANFISSKGESFPEAKVFPEIIEFINRLPSEGNQERAIDLLGGNVKWFYNSYYFINTFARFMDVFGWLEPKGVWIKLAVPRFWRRLILKILRRL